MDSTTYAIAYQYWHKPNGYKNISSTETKKIKVKETKV